MRKETRKRTLVKTIAYRLIADVIVIAIALLTTGSIGAALKIGAATLVAKTTYYYLWERLWHNHISWGLQTVE